MSSHSSNYSHRKNHLTEDELLRYKEGKMNDAEMHRVESHLLDCGLCNDAYEGISAIENKNFKEDISQLKASFHHKLIVKKEKGFQWKWLAAASVLLFILVSFGILLNTGPIHENKVVQNELNIENEAIVENEPVVAENIQDTLINHHIALNNQEAPSSMEHQANNNKPPVLKPILSNSEIREVSDQTIELKNEDFEDIVIAESLPEVYDKIELKELAEVEKINEEENSKSLSYSLQGKTSGIQTKKERLSNPRIVSGKVVDDAGTPIPGVNILVKGKAYGTVTDVEGNYQLAISSSDKILVYSNIGFLTEEVAVNDSIARTIELQQDVRALSEVVVSGYSSSPSDSEQNVIRISPKPSIGMSKFKQYVKDSIQYPEMALKNKIEGIVSLRFNINPAGDISEIHVIKSLGHGLDDEAVRLLTDGPAWKPATVNGTPVSETVTLKIPFKIKRK